MCLQEVEASAKASKLDGTPSFSRLGVHRSDLANAALRGSALGAVQDGQPLSVVTTAADNLPAGMATAVLALFDRQAPH